MIPNKLSIRPIINNIDTDSCLDTESFQNKTLRPILKLQNELIIRFFKVQLQSKKIKLETILDKENKITVSEIFKKDNSLKIQLQTLIIAHFTLEEYEIYLTKQKEFNKRIITMTIQRINDNIKS